MHHPFRSEIVRHVNFYKSSLLESSIYCATLLINSQ